jgi:CHAT domain-containing protein
MAKKSFFYPILFTSLLVLLSQGCISTETRIEQYNKFKSYGDSKNALDTMRQEIADPIHPNDINYLVNIRVIAIDALGNYQDKFGLSADMDQEALQYYQEALKNSSNDMTRQAMLTKVLINYYSSTGRNGLALPYEYKNLENWQEANNTYQVIMAYDGLSATYSDIGQLELEEYNREKAFELATQYFVKDKGFIDTGEWLGYLSLLRKKMDDIAEPGNETKILELWKIQEAILNERSFSPKYTFYTNVAQYMAIAGNIERARSFFQQAQSIAQSEGYSPELPCVDSLILFYADELERASKKSVQCLDWFQSRQQDPGPSNYKWDGLIHEKLGRLDRAISSYKESINRFEKTRSSYSVAERATFFRSSVREPYWGLIRCLIKKFIHSGEESDFLTALQASELVRGRQFGDMKGKGIGERITLDMLKNFRSKIHSDEMILDFIATDLDLILFIFSKELQHAYVLPYDSKKFRKQIALIVNMFSVPDSDLQALYSSLTDISNQLFVHVRQIIEGKKRLVVLSDGALNAVPFDLLTLKKKKYRPLIQDKEILNAPSIAYLISSRNQIKNQGSTGLFALADPAYSTKPEIPGASVAETRAITRGSDYLAYFSPLPETRTEAEEIAKAFKEEPVKKLYGKDALESTIKKSDLRKYGFLHFATHGILGGDLPGLSEPALVMAEEQGEDGFLTASEARELKLNADLTVLSACNTGTGKYFTGEGVMGMSRSFLLAGSRSALVSLWQVPSKETEQLMILFYKHLRSGEDLPAAIRKAKLEMIKQYEAPVSTYDSQSRGAKLVRKRITPSKELHPFFWAAFIPIGA